MSAIGRWLKRGVALLALLLTGPAVAAMSGMAHLSADWRTASREPMGLAPDPATTEAAVLQVYGARAFSWRGIFAVHTWIATKRAGASSYRTYEVIGWRLYHGGRAVVVREGPPDRRWYGAEPKLLLDRRGAGVSELIDKVETAVLSYPYPDQYRAWPGPNSNTFTAWVGRSVPELRLDLPPTAVGKDYLGPTTFAAAAPSGSGFQLSLFGLVGMLAAVEEGLEINVLGLNLGIDPLDLSLRLPGVGRVP